MTEHLESFADLDYTNESDLCEEEADKFNELTFGDEIPWDYDQPELNDQENSYNEFNNKTPVQLTKLACEESHFAANNTDDLLGLTGSFFGSGLFKSNNKVDENDSLLQRATGIDDFELDIKKLGLIDKLTIASESNLSEQQQSSTVNFPLQQNAQLNYYQKRLEELNRYSEFLFQQFTFQQKHNSTNFQILNQVVTNHMNLLMKMLENLQLPTDSLSHLRYFRIMKNFIAIDRRLNEIQVRFAHNPLQRNNEIAVLVQNFTVQPHQQQMELCMTHPFYANLMSMIMTQKASGGSAVGGQNYSPVGNFNYPNRSENWAIDEERRLNADHERRNRLFDANEGGWMSGSERDWLIKIQMRNLNTENPYIHDYYYTKWKLKDLTATRENQLKQTQQTLIPDPASLIPSPITAEQIGAGIDPNKDGICPPYKPIHLEKSLGVLNPSNLNTPRQIIQLPTRSISNPSIGTSSTPFDSPTNKSVRNHRELLGVIEKMYLIVLRVDEVDKSLARMLVEQHKNRTTLIQHRNYLLKLLMDCIGGNNDRFTNMFSITKGARLIASIIACVTTTQFIEVLRMLFFNCLSIWDSLCFAQVEQNMKSVICSRIKGLKRDELSMIVTSLFCNLTQKSLKENAKLQPLSGFISRQFGLNVVLTVLDTFLQYSPDDKPYIEQLLLIIVNLSESKHMVHSCLTEFHNLSSSDVKK